jgi:hypothetical protein
MRAIAVAARRRMELARVTALFVVTALAEIVGC